MLHYGEPLRLAHILLSIGVLGCYDQKEHRTVFVHEFSETRVATLFRMSNLFSVHPVYGCTLGIAVAGKQRLVGSEGNLLTAVVHPSEYLAEEEDPAALEGIGEKTAGMKTELLAEFVGIGKGQKHFRRFEKWVGRALQIGFLRELAGIEEQIRAEEGGKRFEIIYEVMSSGSPWDEIKGKYQTYRLLVECKNTEHPTDEDLNKLVRDMDALKVRMAVLAYRSDQKREPEGEIVHKLRGICANRGIVIIAMTSHFILQCLQEKKEDACVRNFRKLWREHVERWLVS